MVRARYHFDNVYWDLTTVIGPYILFQVGDLNCNPGYIVDDHIQDVNEVTYVVSGSGKMWIDNQLIRLQPHMLIVNRIGDCHRIATNDGETLRYFYLGFKFVNQQHLEAIQALKDFFDKTERRVIYNVTGLQEAFISMFTEIILQDAVTDVMLESCMHRIICSAYRLFTRKSMPAYWITKSNSMDEGLVYDVVHYIDDNAEKIGLLSQLCTEFGYSYDHIAKRFSMVTGHSLRDYYNTRRFEKACDFLRSGNSVTAVSELLGYKSIHAFSNGFKKWMDMSPSEYLRRAQLDTISVPLEKHIIRSGKSGGLEELDGE